MRQQIVSLVCIILLVPLALLGQEPPKKPDQQPMGGASTGAPATYTSRRTVGITDPNAPVVFEDVTDKTSLASFRNRSGCGS